MKLIRAKFWNYRLLKDLELHFSTDETRRLTVIRAANETGKTTIKDGLQWILYGSAIFGTGANKVRLSPISWDFDVHPVAAITGTLEFTAVRFRKNAKGEKTEEERRYRLERRTSERERREGIVRDEDSLSLLEERLSGWVPISDPAAFVGEVVPEELREVFFTDGDRALSFIQADTQTQKRRRVENAVRSLLGIGVVEAAARHVSMATRSADREASSASTDSDIRKLSSEIDRIGSDSDENAEKLSRLDEQIAQLTEDIQTTDTKLSVALEAGDRSALGAEILALKSDLATLRDQSGRDERDHTKLFRSPALVQSLVSAELIAARDRLNVLRDQGRIPSTTIPVLAERMKLDTCICGESLDTESEAGKARVAHIEGLIEASKSADELQTRATSLFFGSEAFVEAAETDPLMWTDELKSVVVRKDGLEQSLKLKRERQRQLESQLALVPDTNVQDLREHLKTLQHRRRQAEGAAAETRGNLAVLAREGGRLEEARKRTLKQQSRNARLLAILDSASDVKQVLQETIRRIKTEEVQKVSLETNRLFLKMIGADEEQRSIIRKAVVTNEFDILVSGPRGRALDPDKDLNGASRRALTLAFILALTRVSEIEAPNVIDTPLGMTSGFVKQSILEVAIAHSSQLVMFLTYDEIRGCETLIDKYAGLEYTLTNTAHFPRMLVNDPNTTEYTTVRCECSHRETCRACERHPFQESEVGNA